MGLILDGKVVSSSYSENLKLEFAKLARKACLAIIHKDDAASASYLKGRLKIASELGVEVKIIDVKDEMETSDLLKIVNDLNNDSLVDGIMIDRPLPKKYDEDLILAAISENKDVDGYTPNNLGRLLAHQDCFASCTPQAAISLLDYYKIDVSGKDVLVIGRSVNVGKPLALLLLNKNATVTIAHSKTTNLKEKCKKADIIFLALGKAKFLKKEDINENTIIVDIGINFDEFNKLCGDADRECYEVAKAYSPVPGGVGVMTNVILMENLLKAIKKTCN